MVAEHVGGGPGSTGFNVNIPRGLIVLAFYREFNCIVSIYRMATVALFGVLSYTLLPSTGLAQTCWPKGEDGLPLSTFPDQFSTEIEANILH